MAIALAGKKTKYKGVEFRSKLEASWAEFFDNERVPWEYELRSFQVALRGEKEQRLTPDFLLMDRWWVEVKPEPGLFFDNERLARKYHQLQRTYSKRLLLVWGTPLGFESIQFDPAKAKTLSYTRWRHSYEYVHLLAIMQTYRDAVRLFNLDVSTWITERKK